MEGWKAINFRMQKFGGDVVHLHKIFHFLNSTNPEGLVDLKGVNHVLFFVKKKPVSTFDTIVSHW